MASCFRPGLEVGDVVADVAAMLAIARSPSLPAHLFKCLARQAEIMRGLVGGEERAVLPR